PHDHYAVDRCRSLATGAIPSPSVLHDDVGWRVDLCITSRSQYSQLLHWRTILDNVLLPVELVRQSRREARRQALDLLRLFDLQEFAGHRPQHLSGGMQQRVALARTLMLRPSVLLMDEPFGALDAITREQLNLELLRMWRHGNQTVVFITHDITEAVFLADRVLVMSRRPGTIAATYTVPFPRPRSLDTRYEPAFAALCRNIHHAMGLMRHDG
ncbi:MAG: ABC transporter ATP-binding protein, partial [Candidatus Tectomicrobia bacterium]